MLDYEQWLLAQAETMDIDLLEEKVLKHYYKIYKQTYQQI